MANRAGSLHVRIEDVPKEFLKQRYAYLFAWWRYFERRWELIILGLLAVSLLVITIWLLPQWMVQKEYWDWSKHPDEYSKHVDDYRKTLVQIIGGAFLLYGLYLTQRRTKATEETLRATQESLKIARESLTITRETQVTDRFTKAITQLGAIGGDGKKQLEIRLGGIYSLERIARDSPDDHWPIMEILAAYIRVNSPWIEPEDEDSDPLFPFKTPPLPKDIQAVMTVIGRRKWEQDKGPLDLSFTDLRGVNLPKAHLEKANLFGVHLEHANLMHAHLEEASLLQANLKGAWLDEAHMDGALLFNAHMEGANLSKAHLSQAQLDETFGDHVTQFPAELTYPNKWLNPSKWLKNPNEKDSTASEKPPPNPSA